MRKQWWIAAPVAWVAVVVIVAALAWWVIDGAGQRILAEPPHKAVTPTATATSSRAADPTASRSSKPEHSPSASTSAEPSGSPSSTGPSTVPPASTSTATGTSTKPPPPPPATTPAQHWRTETWQGEAGLVRVSCSGPTLRLDGASPYDGYKIEESEHHGGRELEVKFRSADGEREVEIHVVCVGGSPHFDVEQSGGDD